MPDPPHQPDLIPPPPGGVELAPGVRVPDADLHIQFSRGSGPGGQNVNKVNSRAELWVPIAAIIGLTDRAKHRLIAAAGHRFTQAGELHLASDTHRTQEANRSAIFDRLRELIVQAKHEPRCRRKTKPSLGSKLRRLAGKKHRAEVKAKRRRMEE